ncbi:JmjC domain-containing protein [Caenorhabditis elegans]|nr:JmjC domain-containing protein [Caenorhabditis elegans]CCD68427.1 JmjC domain-containing protein [Caenorhabditis elegans]|eukprot:NP_509452.2 Lysine-specific demethylase jmjd-3.1 [Caenorhabditis elegans]
MNSTMRPVEFNSTKQPEAQTIDQEQDAPKSFDFKNQTLGVYSDTVLNPLKNDSFKDELVVDVQKNLPIESLTVSPKSSTDQNCRSTNEAIRIAGFDNFADQLQESNGVFEACPEAHSEQGNESEDFKDLINSETECNIEDVVLPTVHVSTDSEEIISGDVIMNDSNVVSKPKNLEKVETPDVLIGSGSNDKLSDMTEQIGNNQHLEKLISEKTEKSLSDNETTLKPVPVQHTNSVGSSIGTTSGDSEISDDDQKSWSPKNESLDYQPASTSSEFTETTSVANQTESNAGSVDDYCPRTSIDIGLDSSAPSCSSDATREPTPIKKRGRKKKEQSATEPPIPRTKRAYTKNPNTIRKRRMKKNQSDDEEDDGPPKRRTINYQIEFRDASGAWTMAQQLIFVRDFMSKKNDKIVKLSKSRQDRVDKFILQFQKTQDSHYMRAAIQLNTIFPDQGNYRHCQDYLKDLTIRVVVPPKRREGKRKSEVPANPPALLLTGPLYLNFYCTSQEVLEAAGQLLEFHVNAVYKDERLQPPVADKTLLDLERAMYHEQVKDLTDYHKYRIPCPTLTVTTKEEVFSSDFERILNSASITNISGIAKALNIKTELFSLPEIAKCHPELSIDILNQVPQSADGNCDSKGIRCWDVTSYSSKMKLQDFERYMQKEESEAMQAFETISNCTAKELESTCQKLKAERIAAQNAIEGCDETMPWIKFGTNIDLLSENFKKQMNEIEKLPTFLLPNREGNLLNYAGVDVLGINTVQMYAKPIGSRTPAHMENSLMASINWNRGPGTCVWFAVPYEYWGQLEFMIGEHGHKYQDQDYWPSEKELLELGVPVIKFEQKADEMVYVNTGCFHWVQSNSFCINVSWNVGQPNFTQLATSIVAHDHNMLIGNQAHVPLVNLVWNAARQRLFVDDPEMYKAMRGVMIRSLAHSKWYFDLIDHHDYIVGDASEWKLADRVQRCKYCTSEIFNIVRWYTTEDLSVDSYPFCSHCHVANEYKKDRFLKYTWFFSLETLVNIFDAYVPN